MYSTHTNFLAAFAVFASILFGGVIAASAQTHSTLNMTDTMGGMTQYYSSSAGDTGVVELRGSEEVPPVSTDTYGAARAVFDDSGDTLYAVVGVANGNDITAAHLHCGERGENGPVIVTLFNDAQGRDVDGILSSLSIDSDDIADVSCSNTIGYDIDTMDDLDEALREGDIYLNVHDREHPNGVIRGQLSMEDDENEYDNDQHKRDCDSRWNNWKSAHQYDKERWHDSEDGKNCAQYGYHDNKDWYGHNDSTSDRYEGHTEYAHHESWGDDYDRDHGWSHGDSYNDEWKKDSLNDRDSEHDWKDDADHEWNQDSGWGHDRGDDTDRDSDSGYHNWHDDDDSYKRRGGIDLGVSVGSIRSSLRI